MNADTDLAWAAGVFDGEGSVFILKSKGRYHDLRLAIQMTHKPTIERLGLILSGTVRPSTKGPLRPRCRRPWKIVLAGPRATAQIKRLRPYLVTKAEEADVALQFSEISKRVGGGPLTESQISEREELRVKLHQLKEREWKIE